ncbi:hypothetical protein OF83DRAFT_924685 [Amylostereum chailletii]|nr:hypothetical protein OF83DRAFT_924685 [Amylostereum chailletii]
MVRTAGWSGDVECRDWNDSIGMRFDSDCDEQMDREPSFLTTARTSAVECECSLASTLPSLTHSWSNKAARARRGPPAEIKCPGLLRAMAALWNVPCWRLGARPLSLTFTLRQAARVLHLDKFSRTEHMSVVFVRAAGIFPSSARQRASESMLPHSWCLSILMRLTIGDALKGRWLCGVSKSSIRRQDHSIRTWIWESRIRPQSSCKRFGVGSEESARIVRMPAWVPRCLVVRSVLTWPCSRSRRRRASEDSPAWAIALPFAHVIRSHAYAGVDGALQGFTSPLL